MWIPGWEPGEEPFAQVSQKTLRLAKRINGAGWTIAILISERERNFRGEHDRKKWREADDAAEGGLPWVKLTSEDVTGESGQGERAAQKFMKAAVAAGHFERDGGPGPLDGWYRLSYDRLALAEAAEASQKAKLSEVLKSSKRTSADPPKLIICPGSQRTMTLDHAVQSVRLRNVNLPEFVAESSIENGELVCEFRTTQAPASAPPTPPSPPPKADFTEQSREQKFAENAEAVSNQQSTLANLRAATRAEAARLTEQPSVTQERQILAALGKTPVSELARVMGESLLKPNPKHPMRKHRPAFLIHLAEQARREWENAALVPTPPAPKEDTRTLQERLEFELEFLANFPEPNNVNRESTLKEIARLRAAIEKEKSGA